MCPGAEILVTPHTAAASCCKTESHIAIKSCVRTDRQADTLLGHTHTQGTHLMSGSPTQIHCKFKFYYKTRGMLEYTIIVTTKIQRNPETL